jgi:uncharacterized protein YceK
MSKSVLGSVMRLASLMLVVGALLSGCASKGGTNMPPPTEAGDMSVSPACAAMKCENPSAVCCGGEPCVDLTISTVNCGACGKACRTRESCNNGNCVCLGGGRLTTCSANAACCSDGCHDVSSDPLSCGGCGIACKKGELCESGQCKCGPAGISCKTGQVCCGSVCSDNQSDAKNCGMCGKECKPGKACKNGLCEGECVGCLMGETCCDGKCVNLLNDRENCGRCTNTCKDILGIPLPCLFGICAFMQTDMGAKDM